MTDPLWTELHDVEHRVRRLEDDLIRRATETDARAARREFVWRRFGPLFISGASLVLVVLSRLHVI